MFICRSFQQEIIGHSAGPNKDAELVYKALTRIDRRLDAIQLFHTDHGNEFNNKLVDEVLETFEIEPH